MKIGQPKLKGLKGRRRSFILLLFIVLLLSVVGGFFVYRQPDTAAAKRFAQFLPFPAGFAGARVIWASEIFSQEEYTKVYGTRTNQVIPESPKIRADVLDHLIEVRLVATEATRNRVRVTNEEIDAEFETLAAQNGGREQILATLKDLYGMDERSFKKLMTEQLLIRRFQNEVLVTVSVRHILVKDQNKASELVTKAKEGADFAQLAKENSEDAGSKEAGGSLGFINRGATVKPFEDVAFSQPVGRVSDPVQSELGWHIILVEEKRGTIDKSYADWLAEAKNKTRIVKLLTR